VPHSLTHSLSLAALDSSLKGGAKAAAAGALSVPLRGTAPPKGDPRPAGDGGNPSARCGGHLPFQGRQGFWTRVPCPSPLSPLKGEMSPQRQRGCSGGATRPSLPTFSVAAPLRRARVLPLPNPAQVSGKGRALALRIVRPPSFPLGSPFGGAVPRSGTERATPLQRD
jgi:hypothetical protein